MNKQINRLATVALIAFLASSVAGWAAIDCPSCAPGFVCSVAVDSNGCCWGSCSQGGSGGDLCGGIVCDFGYKLNTSTCECEQGIIKICNVGQYNAGSPLRPNCLNCPLDKSGCGVTSSGQGGIITCQLTDDCVASDATGSYTYNQPCNYSK